MKKIIKKISIYFQKGTSLVELLLYMGILMITLTILTSIFVSALDVQLESQSTSGVEQDGNYILTRLNYDIHRAQNISIPAANGDINNSFQIVINGISYSYSVDADNNLIFTNDNNLETNNLSNYNSSISNFSVQRLGNAGGVENTLRISFTVTSRSQKVSGPETRNFQTNLSLRRQ